MKWDALCPTGEGRCPEGPGLTPVPLLCSPSHLLHPPPSQEDAADASPCHPAEVWFHLLSHPPGHRPHRCPQDCQPELSAVAWAAPQRLALASVLALLTCSPWALAPAGLSRAPFFLPEGRDSQGTLQRLPPPHPRCSAALVLLPPWVPSCPLTPSFRHSTLMPVPTMSRTWFWGA